MGEEPGGHGHAGRLQHGRPVEAVEADDLLAHEVKALAGLFPVAVVRLPAPGIRLAEAEGGDVVRERIHPDVEHVARIVGDRDPPLHPGPADAEVLQALPDHGQHFVAPPRGVDADAAGADLVGQPVRVGREAEEEVLLLRPLAGPLVVGAEIARLPQLVLRLEGLAPRAVPAGVRALVDRLPPVGAPGRPQPLPQREHAPLVNGIGGADEAVVGDVQPLPEVLEAGRDLVAVLLLGDAALAGDALDVLAVLVGPREEECVPAPQAPGAGDHVGRNRGVGMPHVGNVVHVVDGRREVEALLLGHVTHGCAGARRRGPPPTPPSPAPRSSRPRAGNRRTRAGRCRPARRACPP